MFLSGGGCVHMRSLDPYEASLIAGRFAALRRAAKLGDPDLRLERWGDMLLNGRRAGPCATCGMSRLARGDDLMACLHCAYTGCWSPGRREGLEGRHIQCHLVREGGHWLAAHVDRLEVYCARCGDFVSGDCLAEFGLQSKATRSSQPLLAPGQATRRTKRKQPKSDDWWAKASSMTTISLPPPNKKQKTTPDFVAAPRRGCNGWFARCIEGNGVPSLVRMEETRGTEQKAALYNRHGLRGLHNMGNTCFMSCILQVLAHNPAIQAFFLHGGHERCASFERAPPAPPAEQQQQQYNNGKSPQHSRPSTPSVATDDSQQQICLACEMAAVFALLFADDDNEPVVPHRMLYATWKFADRLAGYEQQDAHEFLMVILDALALHTSNKTSVAIEDKEENNSSSSVDLCSIVKDETPEVRTVLEGPQLPNLIYEVFRGTLESQLVCESCGNVSSTPEHFFDLSLALPSQPRGQAPLKLEDCLSRFTSSEILPDLASCQACGAEEASRSKQMTVEKLPNVLIIHLKRFDAVRDRKICDRLEFPLRGLDLGAHLTPYRRRRRPQHSAAQDDQMQQEEVVPPKHVYDLSAVVNHTGSDLARGHYTAYVREGGAWFMCDDTKVTQVEPEEVANSEGYILFYVRSTLTAKLEESLAAPAAEQQGHDNKEESQHESEDVEGEQVVINPLYAKAMKKNGKQAAAAAAVAAAV